MKTIVHVVTFFILSAFAICVPLQAEQVLRPLTSGEGPATLKSCTPQELGQNPHPALLAACLYLPFSVNAEVWKAPDEPNRLLALYATIRFHTLLQRNDHSLRQNGVGLQFFEIFFSDEKFDDFEIITSSFDAEKGLVSVETVQDGKPYFYYVLFVVEQGMWRVDDIRLFHNGCHMTKSIYFVLSNPIGWFYQLSNCGKR